MSNGENNSEDLDRIRSFVLDSKFQPQKNRVPEEWNRLDWSKWREIRLEELLAEEKVYWEEKNLKDLKEWQWVELGSEWVVHGKENYDYISFDKFVENQLHYMERRGYKIHPESLTPNRYGEGYIILASRPAGGMKEEIKRNLTLTPHLDEKKAEFEKELDMAQELLQNERLKKKKKID